jgi:acyl-CoA reductase-like NAD-dependent aldehyde dehydrogenase
VHPAVHGDLLDALVPKVEAIPLGDPASESTRLGALISEVEARRVEGAPVAPACRVGRRYRLISGSTGKV